MAHLHFDHDVGGCLVSVTTDGAELVCFAVPPVAVREIAKILLQCPEAHPSKTPAARGAVMALVEAKEAA